MAGGRPPKGPKLVGGLGGSAHARRRLEAILETISGGTTVREACERLGVGETAFYRMRASALEAARESLEPKPMGRPPKLRTEADRRIADLEAENGRLKKVVTASQVREELALAMPFLPERRKLREELNEKLEGLRGGKTGRRRAGGHEDRSAAARSEGRPAAAGRPAGPGESEGTQARRTDEGRDESEDDAGQ